MNSSIKADSITSLLDSWIEAERNGVKFPVPFDMAYPIAGYSRKDSAKRYLPKSAQGGLYHVSRIESKGRPVEQITLSVAGLEHLCLMADTDEGYQIREYFRASRTKWEMVKQVAPAVASRVEELAMQMEFERLRQQTLDSEYRLLAFRDTVLKLQPPAIADRVLGVTTIEKIETRTKIVDEAGFILNTGETVSKTELAGRYGLVSKTGKPDTKTVTRLIDEAIASGAIPNPWKDVRVVASAGFDAGLVPILDKFFDANPAQRQRWIGE